MAVSLTDRVVQTPGITEVDLDDGLLLWGADTVIDTVWVDQAGAAIWRCLADSVGLDELAEDIVAVTSLARDEIIDGLLGVAAELVRTGFARSSNLDGEPGRSELSDEIAGDECAPTAEAGISERVRPRPAWEIPHDT